MRIKDRFRRRRTSARIKFYKHLRIYLIFNVVFLCMAMRHGNRPDFLPLTFFWGIGLFLHFLLVFRPWVSRSLSRQWEVGRLEAGSRTQEEDELELRQIRRQSKRRGWSDRDLV